jgi:pyruvate/2-oxoglutarate dehydrogenase complex dihydrolipoamide dehydrogenase (E3) component
MTVEYDLIVIGSSQAAIYAARTASNLNARVALVENNDTQKSCQETLYTQALNQVGYVAQKLRDAPQFGIHFPITDSLQQPQIPKIDISEAKEWASLVVSNCSEKNSSAVLASLGVDIVQGVGEFCRKPHLGVVVNNRRIRARAYLIATNYRPIIPDIEGLKTVGYVTPADIWKVGLKEKLPGEESSKKDNFFLIRPSANWVIIGGSATSIELAQTLARLNCNVTLVVAESHILPKEDPEASILIQAQLEAESIRILTDSPVTQVRLIDDKKWIQAGNLALEADEVLLAVGEELNIESLNLEGVGVKFNKQGIAVNEKLQTTNPRIYACGDSAQIAQYQASIAVKNALFAPFFQVNYQSIPSAIFSEPQLASVGLTEALARKNYGKDVFVARQYFKTLDKAQILGETTGFCKIVGRKNGEILGATIVASQASEIIVAIALAIQHKIKISSFLHQQHVSPTFSEIIQHTAIEWQKQRFKQNHRLQNFLEGWFNLRRKWSS